MCYYHPKLEPVSPIIFIHFIFHRLISVDGKLINSFLVYKVRCGNRDIFRPPINMRDDNNVTEPNLYYTAMKEKE